MKKTTEFKLGDKVCFTAKCVRELGASGSLRGVITREVFAGGDFVYVKWDDNERRAKYYDGHDNELAAHIREHGVMQHVDGICLDKLSLDKCDPLWNKSTGSYDAPKKVLK